MCVIILHQDIASLKKNKMQLNTWILQDVNQFLSI